MTQYMLERRRQASLSQMTIKLQNCMKRLEVECDNYSERDSLNSNGLAQHFVIIARLDDAGWR